MSFIKIEFKNDKYVIIDSEFEENLVGTYYYYNSIIDCYTKKNLNVAKNLSLYLKWYQQYFPISSFNSIREHVFHIKNHNKHFYKFEKDLEKYLILL